MADNDWAAFLSQRRTAPAASAPAADGGIESLITSVADRFGVPTGLALSLAETESGLNPSALGPATKYGRAQGLFQVMPAFLRDYGITKPLDPEDNATGALRRLRENYDRFGSWDLAVAAHHAGPGAVEKARGIPDTADANMATRDYVAKVLGGAQARGAQGIAPRAWATSGDTLGEEPAIAQEREARRITNLEADPLRGVKRGFEQSLALGGGTAALAGDTLDIDALRDWGLQFYNDRMQRAADVTAPSDSISDVLEGKGTVGQWLVGNAGYLGYQVAESILSGGAGAIVGRTALKGLMAPLASGLVTREAARIAATEAGARMTAEQIGMQAAKNAATQLGAAAGIFANNWRQEAGGIYPEAIEGGREADLFKVFTASAAAAGVDTVADAMAGAKVLGLGERAAGGFARRAAKETAIQVPVQGGTEAVQGVIEDIGAGKDPMRPEGIRQRIDEAAVGALGGLFAGVGAGVPGRHEPTIKPVGEPTPGQVPTASEVLKATDDPVAAADAPITPVVSAASLDNVSTPADDVMAAWGEFRRQVPLGSGAAIPAGSEVARALEGLLERAKGVGLDPDNLDGLLLQRLAAANPLPDDAERRLAHSAGIAMNAATGPRGNGDIETSRLPVTVTRLPLPDATAPTSGAIAPISGTPEAVTDDQVRAALAQQAQREQVGEGALDLRAQLDEMRTRAQDIAGGGLSAEVKRLRAEAEARKSANIQPQAVEVPRETVPAYQPNATAAQAWDTGRESMRDEIRRMRSGIDEAAAQAATSPRNDLAQPTDGQKSAENYFVGKVMVGPDKQTMRLHVENEAGTRRRPEWPPLRDHYGRLPGAPANDGSNVDVFVKPGTSDVWAGTVYVIDQRDPKTGKFDEHKAVWGAESEAEAREIYLRNYEPGWQGLGAITAMPWEQFRGWAYSGGGTHGAIAYRQESAQPSTEPAPSTPDGQPAESGQPAAEAKKDQDGNPVLEKGQRVVITGGHAKELIGRHGVIKDVNVLVSRMLYLGAGMDRDGERSYYYTVKTDGGIESAAMHGADLTPESGEAPAVTPDPVIAGRAMTHEQARQQVQNWQNSINQTNGKIARARTEPSKREHRARLAEQEQKKAEAERELAAWEAEHGKPAPVRTPEAPKVSDEQPAAPRLAEVTVQKTKHGKTGVDLWVAKLAKQVERDVYDRVAIAARRHGGKWSKWSKGFEFYSEQGALDFQKQVMGAAPTEIARDSTPTAPVVDKKTDSLADLWDEVAQYESRLTDDELKALTTLGKEPSERDLTAFLDRVTTRLMQEKFEERNAQPEPAQPKEAPTQEKTDGEAVQKGRQGPGQEVTSPAPAQSGAPAFADVPAAFLAEHEVTIEVYSAEDEATYEVTMPVDKALATMNEELSTLRAVLDCVRSP